jgi:hypothetical protein
MYSKAFAALYILMLMVLAATAHATSASTTELIYKQGDWIRYSYIIRTQSETCIWIIRVTIREVNATHVRYDAGLEGMVSGGKLCESLTTLLAMSLGFESARPVDLRTTTPESKRILISPNYTESYSFDNVTVTYYKGVLIKFYQTHTAFLAGSTEIEIIDTSIDALKPLITATMSISLQTPTTATVTITEISTTTIRVTETLTTTVEKPVTSVVTSITTVYQRDWGTAIGLAIALLVVGIVIGRLTSRK